MVFQAFAYNFYLNLFLNKAKNNVTFLKKRNLSIDLSDKTLLPHDYFAFKGHQNGEIIKIKCTFLNHLININYLFMYG